MKTVFSRQYISTSKERKDDHSFTIHYEDQESFQATGPTRRVLKSQEYSTCLIALNTITRMLCLKFLFHFLFLSIRILLSWEQKKHRKRFPDNISYSELVFYILADG